MSEEHTAGGKEFVGAMVTAAVLYVVCAVIMAGFDGYPFVGGIISVVIFAVFGFFVLTRYTARFTYTLKNDKLRINRMIGKRNKEVELDFGCVTSYRVGAAPPGFVRRPYMMRKSIIAKKHSMYIAYTDREGKSAGVVIEPSARLGDKIRRKADKAIKARLNEENT